MGSTLACCAQRDGNNSKYDETVLSFADRNRFKRDLAKRVNLRHLHDEVLSGQMVLDFDTYMSMMGLINRYTTQLTNHRNDETFERRLQLLNENNEEEYNEIVAGICRYSLRLSETLTRQAQDSLQILDEQIIINSHDTYSTRQQLFDHMNSEIEKNDHKQPKKKYDKIADQEVIDEAIAFYSENLSSVNEELLKAKTTDDGAQQPQNTDARLEEESIKLEDQVYLAYGIHYKQLRKIIQSRQATPAE